MFPPSRRCHASSASTPLGYLPPLHCHVPPPQAWFKHAEPHPLWGIFPRLAYEMFKDKTDGWKITMKYFQNVVDTVR